MSEYSYDDPDHELDEKVKCAVLFDDSEDLILLMMGKGDSYCDTSLLTNICMHDSVKCAAALLEGKLGAKLHVNQSIYWQVNVFHLAAQHCSKGLIQLFLNYGARTDIRSHDNSEYNGMLPLNMALHTGRRHLLLGLCEGLSAYQKIKELSTFELIVTLCLPHKKFILAANKLLAWSSKNIEKEAYHYAMEGKLIELALLLIVAREKVLVPITFHRNDGSRLSGSTTLHECLRNQIMSLYNEDINLMGEVELDLEQLTQSRNKIMVMKTAALLLEVFERAGSRIEEYLRLQQPNVKREQVEKDVALRLEEAGFNLKDGVFNFRIRDWFISSDSVRNPIAFNETQLADKPFQFLSPHMPVLEQTNVFPVLRQKGIPHDGFHRSSVLTPPFPNIQGFSTRVNSITMNQAQKTFFGSQNSTSSNVQVEKITKVIGRKAPSPLPMEKFAYFARLIKKGIRCA